METNNKLDLSGFNGQTKKTLPAGEYLMNVTGAALMDTKDKSGQYIQVELTVRQGEHEGMRLFHNFNVKNNNAKAVEIGLNQLKSFLLLARHMTPNSLDVNDLQSELGGLTVGVKVKIETNPTYGDQPRVHYFLSPKDIKATPVSSASEALPF